ncbi:putative receptor-like protein kinase [Sesamum alatum]|uniref:Receptor-like protein kinase n=1 Tax=Sesamum alatum TaxID=300844 RepID=A0AAE1Y696_9LAMI|nr:putative receptor-like protein kinase [Sesamum alatum]
MNLDKNQKRKRQIRKNAYSFLQKQPLKPQFSISFFHSRQSSPHIYHPPHQEGQLEIMDNTSPRRYKSGLCPYLPPPSGMAILLVLFCIAAPTVVHAAITDAPAKSHSFTPPDNILLDCGNSTSITLPGNRVFIGDQESSKYLFYEGRDIQVGIAAEHATLPSPLYLSAKVFESNATYTFHVARPGWHWIRLHFAPIPNNQKDLKTAQFKVSTSNGLMLVYDFKYKENMTWSYREYLVNVTTERFSLTFEPKQGSVAYISGIEFVSAPDILLGNVASAVFPKAQYSGLTNIAYETVYRLNAGGPAITAQNDTLGRSWEPDKEYLDPPSTGSEAFVEPNVITYPEGESPLIAPPVVYATATQMANANVQVPNFNITWKLKIDTSFQYLVRLHFADIVSKTTNDLYFNVYINGKSAIMGLDLSTVAGGLTSAYFADFVVNSTMVSPLDPLIVQVGPMSEIAGTKNALLNGLEVFKMNSSVGSLDGEFGVGANGNGNDVNGTVAAVGFAMMFGAFIGLGAMAVKWKKRPQDWQKRNSFSSWLLPIHAGDSSFMSASNLGSRKSQFFSQTMGLGRYFSFAELQEATNNWDPTAIIGVGGFGNVYLGHIDDGVKVAVKRGNPQSEQGINEFQTEIQMLSKLRHPINPSLPREQVNLAEWAMQWKRKGLLDKIIDPTLADHINPDSMKKFAEAAEKCLAEYGVDRPTMGDVLWNLEYALQLQEASAEGKSEEENKPLPAPASPAVVVATPASPAADNKPTSSAPETAAVIPTQPNAVDEHSGTAMFAQFAALNGR